MTWLLTLLPRRSPGPTCSCRATVPTASRKALASGADAVVLDLEDAVAVDAKDAARAAVAKWAAAADFRRPDTRVVRINGRASPHFADDVALVADAGLPTVMLPKAESAEDVAAVRTLAPHAAVLALVESARGVAQVDEVAHGRRAWCASCSAPSTTPSTSISTWMTARTGSATPPTGWRSPPGLADLAGPVAGVTPQLDDEARLIADLAWARRRGFGAKLCIHPAQVAPIHAALAPAPEAVAWAERVLAADGRVAGRRSARRPHDRPPGGPAGAADPARAGR